MPRLISFFTHTFFKILFAFYLGIFSLIWLISSPVAKHFITPILAEHQLHLSDDASIRLNPFLMQVTLSDISLSSTESKENDTVFSLGELKIQVALWQLAFDKIFLSEFSLKEGMLKVAQHDNHLIIAGIEIPNNTSTEDQNTDNNTDTQPTKLPYQLVLPELLLNNFHIEIERNTLQQKNKTHHVEIEQFALRDIKATQTSQQINLSIAALIDKTHLNLSANALLESGLGDIKSDISIEGYPIEKLARYVEQLTELKGSLSFKSKQKITIANQGINFKLHQADLNLNDILLGLGDQNITLKSFKNSISNLEVDLKDNVIQNLTGKSTIKLTNAEVIQKESQATIAAFTELNLADINFVLDDEPSVDIADIILDEFLFSKKAMLKDDVAHKLIDKINQLSAEDGTDVAAADIVKLPPVIQLKQLTLNKLHIHQKSIAINSIIFDSLTGAIIVKENKDIANLINLGDKPDEQQNGEEIQSTAIEELVVVEKEQAKNLVEADKEGFTFSFDELRFVNKNTLDFTDFSVSPIYQRTLFIDTLELGALSNNKEKQQEQTPYTLVGRSNKYAKFHLSGFLQPFATMATYHIKGSFKEFSLPAISSYMKASTGLEVKTGRLNTDLDVTLLGDELDGNVIVLLEALETGLVDSEEAGSLIDQGALPLNMAMGMLKDSDGNVELDVPLSGSTSDPKFGLSSIVTLITKKAIMSATQDYLLTTFVPYANIVSIAITAGEFALKLRFDDLDYHVEQIEPGENQDAYLKDFIALMQAKEDTRVTLCAISTPADIGAQPGKKITDKAAIKSLLDIGEQREHALKDHLIEYGKIDSSRILFCKPQIDSSEDALPRIAISV
jgi:hypothetical protein